MTPVDTDTVRVERTFDASPEAVFDAWTNPEVLRRWWKRSETDEVQVTDVDLRVGGGYRLSMRSADGEEHTVAGEYREVERPHRLVYSWAWEGTGPTAGHESLVAVSFNGDEGGTRTTVVIEQSNFMNETSRQRHGHGWNAVLDSLAREVFAGRQGNPRREGTTMAKYVLAYTGGRMADTPEQQQAAMAAWGAFLGGLGDSLVDPGNPFGPSTAVGGGAAPSGLSGYSIISAGSLDEAAEKAQGAPVIANGGGVEVYEALEVEM